MIRTQIQLTEEQSKALKQKAAEQGTSVAELIRRSVDHYLQATQGISEEDRRRRAIAAAGKYRSGRSDVAAEHDRYLAEAYEDA